MLLYVNLFFLCITYRNIFLVEDGEIAEDLMLILGFNESICELSMVSSEHRHVLRRWDGHVLRRA